MLLPLLSANRNTPTIDTVMPNVVWQHDATIANSYTSGQLIKNVILSTGTEYDATLGGNTTPASDDPTFVGPVGAAEAYMALDGTDFIRKGSANNTVVNSLHQTPATAFWYAIALNWASVAGSTTIWGSTLSSTLQGVRLTSNSANNLQFCQRGDLAQVTSNSAAWPTLVGGADYLMIYSTNGTTLRSWVNNRTKIEQAFAFDACVTAASQQFRPCGTLAAGAKYYGDTLATGFIDNADAAKIFDYYNALHKKVYA